MNLLTWLRRHHRLVELLTLWCGAGLFLTLAVVCSDPTPGGQYEGCSARHWLGTLDSGIDLAHCLASATLRSLLVALLASVPAVGLAYVLGGLWGLQETSPRRRMLLAAAVLTFLGPTPLLLTLAILFAFPVPATLGALVLAIAATAWPPLALRICNEVRRLQDEPCVQAARQEGATGWQLLTQEILPLAIPLLESLLVLTSIGAITVEATIGYLGRGALGEESLGSLLFMSQDAFRHALAHGAYDLRLLGCVAAVLAVLIVSLRLFLAWRNDCRVGRTIPQLPARSSDLTRTDPGWTISVWHRGTGKRIVCGVAIPLLRGRITVLAGGSGSGKSISALALAGLLPPELGGKVFSTCAQPVRVLLLPQGLQDNFGADLSVADYLRAAGMPEDMWVNFLKKVGLRVKNLQYDDGTWKQCRDLSGGMAQRLGLVLALYQQPDVLVLDEPLSALDERNARRIGVVLRKLVARDPQLAVVVVNHRPEWTSRFGDHIVYLAEGRTVWEGPVASFFALAQNAESVPPTVGEYLDAWHRLNTIPGRCVPALQAPTVEVSGLSVRYPGMTTPVVEGLSFIAQFGEIVALVAESGGGKSTVLNVLQGSLQPVQGSVRLCDIDPYAGKATARADFPVLVRLCAQNPALTLNLRVPVRKILHRTVRRLRLPPKQTQAMIGSACLLAGFPLSKLSLRPAELSGGLRVRAGLVRALLGSPRVLLVDEVTSGLDPEVVLTVLDSLRTLAYQDGLTIILAGHDPNHLAYLGARTIDLRPRTARRTGSDSLPQPKPLEELRG